MKTGDTIKYVLNNTIQKGKVIDISKSIVLVTNKTSPHGCTSINKNQIICVYTDNWIHLEKWIYETRRMKAEHDEYIKSLYK